jgi:hypothetical protein
MYEPGIDSSLQDRGPRAWAPVGSIPGNSATILQGGAAQAAEDARVATISQGSQGEQRGFRTKPGGVARRDGDDDLINGGAQPSERADDDFWLIARRGAPL